MFLESLIVIFFAMALMPISWSYQIVHFLHLNEISIILNTNDSKTIRSLTLATVSFFMILFVHLLFVLLLTLSTTVRLLALCFIVGFVASFSFYKKLLSIRVSEYLRPESASKRAMVLLVAHPDDECMFFTPAIAHLKKSYTLHLLSLSNGGFDGLGALRENELFQSAQVLGIPRNNTGLVTGNLFPDGMRNSWNQPHIAKSLDAYLRRAYPNPVDKLDELVILTFDEFGVSSHPNHIDTHYGAMEFAKTVKAGELVASYTKNVTILTIETSSLLLKYTSFLTFVFDYIKNPKVFSTPFSASSISSLGSLAQSEAVSTQSSRDDSQTANKSKEHHQGATTMQDILAIGEEMALVDIRSPALTWLAMTKHASQLVWFRRLFIWFSKYTYVSQLKRVF